MSDLRVIPSIEQLRQRDAMRALETRYGRAALLDALRAETAALRDHLGSGHVAAVTIAEAIEAIERGADRRLRASMRPSLISVITVVELTKRMTILAVELRDWITPGLLCAALYFVMSFPLARWARRVHWCASNGASVARQTTIEPMPGWGREALRNGESTCSM